MPRFLRTINLDDESANYTIGQMLSHLQLSTDQSDFDKVEKLLKRREDKLKEEAQKEMEAVVALLEIINMEGDLLILCAGRDATREFEESDHSEEAKKLKEKYYIGEIDSSSNVPIQPYLITTKNIGLNPDQRYGFAPPKMLLQMLLLIFVLGVAFLCRGCYTKRFFLDPAVRVSAEK